MTFRSFSWVLLLFGLPGGGLAQPLADPTAPPAAAGKAADGDSLSARTRLQSVLLSPQRKLAVIDGRLVALGAKHGDATLVRITPTEVVLRGAGEEQVLKLNPAVEKTSQAAKRNAGGPR